MRDPTAWVKTAAKKLAAQSFNFPMPMLDMMHVPQMGMWRMPQSSLASKLIGQFNKRGITTPIQYSDVAEELTQLSDEKIAKILGELEQKKDSVRDPTAWVKVAAWKAPKPGGAGMPQKSPASKLIGDFNKSGVTQPIQYRDVADVMTQLSDGKISQILAELAERHDTVRDPTAWVKTAAAKASGAMHGQTAGGRPAKRMRHA